jgi:hypothetical protein
MWMGAPPAHFFLLMAVWPLVGVPAQPMKAAQPPPAMPSYHITLDIDVAASTYWGQETVRYVNTGAGPLNQIWFLLRPNLKSASIKGASPLLVVQSVDIAGAPAQFESHQSTKVEIALPEPLGPGESVELKLEFFGKVPGLNHAATTLPTHFTEQIRQVIGSRHRRAYLDPPFFNADGVLVLNGFYPVLAPRPRGDWQATLSRAADDVSNVDAANYQVEVRVPQGLSVFTSGEPVATAQKSNEPALRFEGEGLRDCLVIVGSDFRIASQRVGSVEVQSVFLPGDEVVGRQVLHYAADALTVCQSWFGPYPYPKLTLVEAPLPAGRMSAEAACLVTVASAYYVDFKSPRAFALPGLIRESAELIEDALEFNVAYAVARQWWGMLVGCDPERTHFLDNALATYAALLYYEKSYGPEVAQAQMEAQLKAAYRMYRTFGGEDKPVNQPINQFTNGFQYAAIVHVKGALFFDAVRRLLGDEAFATALKSYVRAHSLGRADVPGLLRTLRHAAGDQADQVTRLYIRWITWRRGDQDIARPEYRIVVSTEIKPSQEGQPSAFERLGRIIARQMTRVGKYAVRPF